MQKELLYSGFKRIDMPLSIGNFETMDQSFAFNESNIELDPDLMHVRFILCHEGVNANGDTFTKDTLQKAQFTPRNKPIDWEHSQPVIGTMLDSTYGEDSNGRGYIEAVGVVWKFMYPELSDTIKTKFASGALKVSMECYYKDANYKVGDNLYTQEEADKLGVTKYVGRDYLGQKVSRVFNDVIFGGVGVVANPADKEAIFLSVAKDLGIDRTVNDFTSKIIDKKTIDATTVAKFVKAFDKAKSAIVSSFNEDNTRAKDQVFADVQGVVNSLLSDIASINNDYYSQTASDSIDAKISLALENTYLPEDETKEAYLLEVSEDYFIYEIYDYSQALNKILKCQYSIVDENIEIDFTQAVEVEKNIAFTEKVIENLQEGVEVETMSKVVNKEQVEEVVDVAEATEEVVEEVVEEVIEAAKKDNKNDGDPEDEVDNGDDEDTEDKNGKPKKKKASSDLEAEVADLKSKLGDALASIEDKDSKLQTALAQLDEINKDKISKDRVDELNGLGISLSEARQAKLRGMNDEEYSDFKELLLEVAGTKTADIQESVETAEASEEEVEEEIIVEGAQASAGLHIEHEVKKDVKPFGHLSK